MKKVLLRDKNEITNDYLMTNSKSAQLFLQTVKKLWEQAIKEKFIYI